MPAGALRNRVHCQKKIEQTDEFGNLAPNGGAWATQFTVWAGMVPRNGGESVVAARLEGRQPYIVTVRQSSDTRQITTGWRLVDARDTSRVFNVASLSDPDGERAWIEMLVEQGGAA